MNAPFGHYVDDGKASLTTANIINPFWIFDRVSHDKDVNVGSYTVPKGVPVQMNLYAMHHDNEHWGDPLTFRPHRFLNQQGTAVVMDEWLQPFGYGKLKFAYSAMCIHI